MLLGLVVLLGYAHVQTGLIDRDVDLQTETQLAQLEEKQANLLDRVALRESMEGIRKQAVFTKVITRLAVIVAAPWRCSRLSCSSRPCSMRSSP